MGCHSAKQSVQDTSTSFRPIVDRFTCIAQVQQAVRAAGLESSNLILGVDFTKSNNWTGQRTFNGRCLHDTSNPSRPNPYQQVIHTIGRTLEEFDDYRLIPAFGFGDTTSGGSKCFPFMQHGVCNGVDAVLQRYHEITATVTLSGPTSFAPVIREAIKIVREEHSYHILVIIADGQVTDAGPHGETARAIIEASEYPLSIVVVGVGDGPWDTMESYDDELPARKFDNFQFVDFEKVRRGGSKRAPDTAETMEARFALHALMEIPDQYAFIKRAGLLDPANFPHSFAAPAALAPSPRSQIVPPPPPVLTHLSPVLSPVLSHPSPLSRETRAELQLQLQVPPQVVKGDDLRISQEFDFSEPPRYEPVVAQAVVAPTAAW